jgi:hypothetical protein
MRRLAASCRPCEDERVEIVIRGHNLPGRMFRNAGVPIHNVHVGVQVRQEPTDLVRADAASATDGCGGPRCARVGPPALTWSNIE